ncbi:hypothetical protein EK0264_17140 [Epidermidibacterium keratini]|uniref:Uncharacterized protein n=1 Tax=Epidermidibacterium keratini TaxID=1891644 RepID=A0A7L4YS90_9ACTN|nr:hypothetical protein [Epidermidibacterium keratini]QHC01833.1 hypothetical protein EK0264_17140 [Epidermidibacterium keratini]
MPSWLILVLALGVLVVGVGAITAYGARRRRADRLQSAVAALRARLEGVRYRLDASPLGPAHSEATRLADAAEASLAVARDRRSLSATAEAAGMLDRADAELNRTGT